MNRLPLSDRTKILQMICEGNSLRATARIADVSINTVMKLFVDAGKVCWQIHDEKVVDIEARRIQTDEQWAFIKAKKKNVSNQDKMGIVPEKGDAWTWVAMDADTRMIISWFTGHRNMEAAVILLADLKSRLKNRVQLSADGYTAYRDAVLRVFNDDVDFGQLVKQYGRDEFDENGRRDNRLKYQGAEKHPIIGEPNLKHLSTSYIERVNLTMRMQNRRFTRKTNAFSKKFSNHMYSIAISYTHYNFVRVHSTLGVTPAMKAEIIDRPMTYEEIAIMAETP